MHVLFSKLFLKQLERLEKKHPSLRRDVLDSVKTFDPNRAISIGKNVYKIRILSKGMHRGKSGGLRAYLYLNIQNKIVVPLCLYAKSEMESVSANKLAYFMQQAKQEFLDYL